ncbi:hypothetical protein BC938DRAFT_473903 [Jimgerdemannia flammicorona]|uniref:Protein-S-isoprenylcysteine O-methyltransferase n=1 Tax=Jimgerdemannia flammicorona TaxID=994334 RepID=A0A433Q384_9FUNG|nr:hypothetical protein BC938DRAFT_473903 [Jimgerdemannia flammicorona]
MWTKLLSVLVTGYLFLRGTTPPNTPHMSRDAIEKEGTLLDGFVASGPTWCKAVYKAVIGAFVGTMVVQELGLEGELSKFCPNPTRARLSSWSTADLVGFTCLVAGCLLRLWCYQTLGKYFTFHIAIREDHHIIRVGPYALVRHPSYTGLFLMGVGAHLLLIVKLWQCMPAPIGSHSGTFLVVGLVVFFAGTGKRVQLEEAMMHAKFRTEWEDYARMTKLFVPFLL